MVIKCVNHSFSLDSNCDLQCGFIPDIALPYSLVLKSEALL